MPKKARKAEATKNPLTAKITATLPQNRFNKVTKFGICLIKARRLCSKNIKLFESSPSKEQYLFENRV